MQLEEEDWRGLGEAEKEEQGVGALIRSSASGESLRPIRKSIGGRPKAAPRSSVRRAPWAWWSRRQAREMSNGCPGLCHPPGTEGGGAVSSPVDVDGGGDFVSVVVLVEAQTAPRSSNVVSSMLARLPGGGMGCLCVVPVLLDL